MAFFDFAKKLAGMAVKAMPKYTAKPAPKSKTSSSGSRFTIQGKGGKKYNPQPPPLRRPTPPRSTALGRPGPVTGGGGGGGGGGYYGGGGYGGGGGGVSATRAVATPKRLTDKEWLAKDTTYQAMLKSLDNRLKTFTTDNTAQREKSILDYGQALTRLGWDQKGKAWNQEDKTTAYGNAYQNLLNDFASRGLVQSSLYDQARTDMTTGFGRQRDEMGTSHTNALQELARALSGFKSETQQSKDQARMEALARRAASEMKG